MWVTADGAIVGAWGLAAEVAVSDDNEQPPS